MATTKKKPVAVEPTEVPDPEVASLVEAPVEAEAPEVAEVSPEEAAAEFAKALLEAVKPNREQRRQQARDAKHASAVLQKRQLEADQALIKAKRDKLKRKFGDPKVRQKALEQWIEDVNDTRDGTVVYGEVE